MSDKSMSYGRDLVYVNSATGLSADRVYEVFGEAASWKGSVARSYLIQLSGGAEIFGNVTMRRKFEAHGYSRRTAHDLMARLAPPSLYDGLLPYTWQSSIDTLVTSHRAEVYAAQLKRAGLAAMTDCSSGTTLREP